jgi:hypothetical protein
MEQSAFVAITSSHAGVREDLGLVDRWFRALDQRRIHNGRREWLIHVTSIFVDDGEVAWIQIADGSNGASIILRVSASTPLDVAIDVLMTRETTTAAAHPLVVTALVPWSQANRTMS